MLGTWKCVVARVILFFKFGRCMGAFLALDFQRVHTYMHHHILGTWRTRRCFHFVHIHRPQLRRPTHNTRGLGLLRRIHNGRKRLGLYYRGMHRHGKTTDEQNHG